MAKKTTDQLFEIKNSPIHNLGIYATQHIPKDTRIIEYIGEKITKAESDRRGVARVEEAKKTGDGMVYIFELNKRYDIDGNYPYNTARLINHSCNPNCEPQCIRGHIWVIAIRDIKPGEELNYDYGYDLDHFFDHPCRCGSKNCVGYIVRKDQRLKLKRILKGKKLPVRS